MDKHEVKDVLRQLYNVSGFRVSLHGAEFEEIAAYPEEKHGFCRLIQSDECEHKRCEECDRAAAQKALSSSETLIYKCRYGLVEAISPLYNFGKLTGFLMMGQVAELGAEPCGATAALTERGLSEDEARDVISSIPEVKPDMVEAYVKIMTVCAQYLTLSNAVSSTKPSIAELVIKYIGDNYHKKISIADICDSVGYSKSTVLSAFKKETGTTVGNYLNDFRLDLAKRMIDDSERTINDVALSAGFADQSYFSKVFIRKYGITPSNYRRSYKK